MDEKNSRENGWVFAPPKHNLPKLERENCANSLPILERENCANSFGHLVRVLVFMGLLSIFLANFFIKIGSHGYIFKNYFVTVFLIFNNK